MNNKITCSTAILGLLVSFGASTTVAASLYNEVVVSNTMTGAQTMAWRGQDLTNRMMGTISQNADITNTMGSFRGQMANGNPVWDYSWNLMVDPDPFIKGSFTVTNTSSMMQNFDINFALPVTPAFNTGYMTGSLAGSFSDQNANGVTLNINDWDGLIDNVTQMNLYSFGGIFSAGSSVTIAADDQRNVFFNGPVNNTIGIHMNFDLSAGDKVTFDTAFEVTPIPVPGTVWLLGGGLLGLLRFMRRRSRVA